MHDQASLPAAPLPAGVPPQVLEAVVRAVAAALAPQPPAAGAAPAGQEAGPAPMLTVKQTAALLGLSRMTVIRKADAGELPCVVVCRGRRQKLRRFPKAPVEELAARGAGAQVDLKQFTDRWLASMAAQAADRLAADKPSSAIAGSPVEAVA